MREASNNKKNGFSVMDRLVISGRYGKFYYLGHHINPSFPDEPYMDENAVRARAGILNILSWVLLGNILFFPDVMLINVIYPIVGFEFLSSCLFGLTPIAPVGNLGSVLAVMIHSEPRWTPARPKRFAWVLGFGLSTLCFVFWQLGPQFKPGVLTTLLMCNALTWLESANGFCMGCFIFNYAIVPMFGYKTCVECSEEGVCEFKAKTEMA
jgi:hypothetical protein